MDDGSRIDARKLWAGAAATVVVAALVAAVGVLVVETLLDVKLLSPSERGVLGWSHRASYPAGAAVLALGAAGTLHLLLLGVPRPMVFFGWLMALIGIGLAVVPFGYDAALEVQVCTAAVEVVVVFSVWILLSSAGRRAVTPAPWT